MDLNQIKKIKIQKICLIKQQENFLTEIILIIII